MGRHLAEATYWILKKGELYKVLRSVTRSGKWGRERGWELAPRGPICDCEAPPGEPYAALTAERWLRRDRTQGLAGDGERRYKALDAARAFRDGPEALEKLVCLVLVPENERLLGRRLQGFAEIQLGSYHAPGHTC